VQFVENKFFHFFQFKMMQKIFFNSYPQNAFSVSVILFTKEQSFAEPVDNSHEYLMDSEIFMIVIHRQNDE